MEAPRSLSDIHYRSERFKRRSDLFGALVGHSPYFEGSSVSISTRIQVKSKISEAEIRHRLSDWGDIHIIMLNIIFFSHLSLSDKCLVLCSHRA